MKNIFKGIITAFSMYSTIPMPQLKWDKNSMKYAMCFFPLVGAIIGGLIYLLSFICSYFELNAILFSAGMVLIPLLISGAIHLDGFIDTSDALYSRRELEKKLEILKDPHVGAFGVIMCVTYLILQFGLYGQLYNNTKYIMLIVIGYVLSRSLSGLSIVSFKTAKNTGLAHIFSSNADKKTVKIVLSIYILILFTLMLLVDLVVGGIAILVSAIWFLLYKRLCYKQFGGLTGDLAGYFLQILELLFIFIAMIGGLIC